MKTLEKIFTAFQKDNGSLSFFEFDSDNTSSTNACAGNYEIVEQMAKKNTDYLERLDKLSNMTSRQRSESGIYYKMKLKHNDDWNQAIFELTGKLPLKKVTVKCTASVTRISKSRLDTFRIHSHCLNYPKFQTRIPYTKENMVLNFVII
jgi:hypothetical protein